MNGGTIFFNRLRRIVKSGDGQCLAMEFRDVLCEHESARYAHERSRENPARFHGLPPGGQYPRVIEKTPQLPGRGHSGVFCFPVRQRKGVRLSHFPLPALTFWFTLYGLPQRAARFPPAPSTRYQETKQGCRFIEFSVGRLSLLALILLNIHPLSCVRCLPRFYAMNSGKRLYILTFTDPSVTNLGNAYRSLESLFTGTDDLRDRITLERGRENRRDNPCNRIIMMEQ